MQPAIYIVATPIGNLADFSERAISTLKQVDLIAAEDTRHSKTLLERYAIKTKIIAYHEHNEEKVTPQLIQYLQKGDAIALISDAGTPLINDPGYKLVVAAHQHAIQVIPIPGPSAIITALAAAGLPTDRFIYEGYLPAKNNARETKLKELKYETRTLIFYETPHRVIKSLLMMQTIFGEERQVTIARELTKQFEQIVCGTLSSINAKFENGIIKQKGEFVLLVKGAREIVSSDKDILRINQILAEKMSPKEAAELTAKITNKKKNEVYQLMINNNQ